MELEPAADTAILLPLLFLPCVKCMSHALHDPCRARARARAGRDELRQTLDSTAAKLAATEELLKRLGSAAGIRDTVVQVCTFVNACAPRQKRLAWHRMHAAGKNTCCVV